MPLVHILHLRGSVMMTALSLPPSQQPCCACLAPGKKDKAVGHPVVNIERTKLPSWYTQIRLLKCSAVASPTHPVLEPATPGITEIPAQPWSLTSTLALCYLRKREVMKVVRGELPIHCVIMHTSEATYAVPTPVDTDQQDHFLLRLEVDDPDDPVNNPSLFFVVPKSEAGFYDTSEFNGWLECERWIRKLSGDSSNANFHVLIAIHPSCLTGDCGHALGRKKGKKCTGCRRVVYCSKECQKVDWKEHKPGCNKTLQEIQLEESALVHTPDHIGYTGRGGMGENQAKKRMLENAVPLFADKECGTCGAYKDMAFDIASFLMRHHSLNDIGQVRSQLYRSRSRGSSRNRGKIAAWLPSGRIELATCG
eukprot:gene6996-1646_t